MNLNCRCLGMNLESPCEHQATQEDGLCDACREFGCERLAPEFLADLRAAAPHISSPVLERLADELESRLTHNVDWPGRPPGAQPGTRANR